MITHEDHHKALLVVIHIVTVSQKIPPVEVTWNFSGKFSLISSADFGMVELWPRTFLFSRLMALAIVRDFLMLEVASG
jgi:hypothetical protein